MKLKKITQLCFLLLLVPGCSSGGDFPRWTEVLTQKLKCGMGLDDIKELTNRPINPGWALGQHDAYFVSKRSVDLILYFKEHRLHAFALSKIDGWRLLATRSSPVKHLCHNQILFLLRVSWPTDMENGIVYIDGRKVTASDWWGPFLALPLGKHEIRIVMPDGRQVTKNITFTKEDRGDHLLDLAPETDEHSKKP